ncbi:hypothetical protein NMY22_g4268 [Coprinellus aureogranulatus]|nr:hypothetical protein NMY22_g4268 [Coprinellus aureogranulatus]
MTQYAATSPTTENFSEYSEIETGSSISTADPPTYSELADTACGRNGSNSKGSCLQQDEEKGFLTITWDPHKPTCLPEVPSVGIKQPPPEECAASGTSASFADISAPSPSSSHGKATDPGEESPVQDVRQLPRVPEFRAAVSQFQEEHTTLRGHAIAICNITKRLLDLRRTIFTIQEWWMHNDMEGMAHDVIPILDLTTQAVPNYAFPPGPQDTAAAS